ncbi:MAG: hypothetical protein MJZ72_07200 [Bacteroidales bacterium]|nr:hypothetical protein [Bacteroidales bacterium]
MKKLNWYYAIDVLAVLFFVLLFVFFHYRNQKVIALLAADMGLMGLFLFLEYFPKNPLIPSKVTNNMDEPILAKPETGNTPVQIAPHAEMYGVDGIKVNGKVFKLCSGTHVEVKGNGEIVTKASSAKIINKYQGGYLSQSPDPNWDELFNA